MSDIKTHQIRTFQDLGEIINKENFPIIMAQFLGVVDQYVKIKEVAPGTKFTGFNWIDDGKIDILNPIINGIKLED